MRYLPHTDGEIAEMLGVIGAASLDDLFTSIPEPARYHGELALPRALDEAALMRQLARLAARNEAARMVSFLGAGAYAHHIPPAVDQLLLRSEFYTSYTPYQPEVAQGTLQAIWEFQTIVSELYGLPLANASLYDGASAAAEGVLMARRLTRRPGVVVCGSAHPDYRAVVRTYLSGLEPGAVREVTPGPDGAASVDSVTGALGDDVAAVLVGYPSFYGALPDLRALADAAHARGALLVVANSEPYALALAESPGELGADIAVGEGQPLATAPSFGGPGVGLFACRGDRAYLQQLPGRLCGATVDGNGTRGYVLTLSTREQHIRRERATSNVCTNQGLLALALAIRTSLLGREGFEQVARQCLAKARYLKDRILSLPGYSAAFAPAPYFNEFAVRVRGGDASKVTSHLEARGILAGLDLGRVDLARRGELLVAVTELHERADLDALVDGLASVPGTPE